MAPANQILVTLKLPSDQLRELDFSDCQELAIKKPKKRGGARPRTKKEAEPSSTTANTTSTASADGPSGIIIGSSGTADPVLGNLPRSLKAAPVANTNGLVLDKTPCRKWQRRPLQIRTFAGFSCNLWGWTSDYTEAEWEVQKKQDAIEAEREEALRQERENLRQEALKQEAIKQEAIKQEALRKEALKAEISNAKAAKRAAKKEETKATKTRKPPAKRPILRLKLKKDPSGKEASKATATADTTNEPSSEAPSEPNE